MTKEKHKNPYGLKDNEFRHLEDWQCDRQFCDEFIKFTEPGLFSCGHVWVCWAHRGADATPINIEDFRCEECHKISRFINADENGRVICSHCERGHKFKMEVSSPFTFTELDDHGRPIPPITPQSPPPTSIYTDGLVWLTSNEICTGAQLVIYIMPYWRIKTAVRCLVTTTTKKGVATFTVSGMGDDGRFDIGIAGKGDTINGAVFDYAANLVAVYDDMVKNESSLSTELQMQLRLLTAVVAKEEG